VTRTNIITYSNPVWPGYFADPFVLKWQGQYYAYGTGSPVDHGLQADRRMFPVLHSLDLVHWDLIGGALEPLDDSSKSSYWAPEVAERDGRFYLYYSAGGPAGENHQLRVGIAEQPEGPFTDTGHVLMPDEPFTIDAHPFRDPRDGRWYLFFAKDYFEGDRPGTGTAVVPLADDMISVTGEPLEVLRANHDWHVFERGRRWYERDWEAWYTVEGPFVVEHGGLYYCLYSGGRWETPDYGVSYGVADNVMGPYLHPEGANGPVVLKGVEGRVLGPGHNSVVVGPDDKTEFMVYHAWDTQRTMRRMCIDPLIWTTNGPKCQGPSIGEVTVDLNG
jgi:arabinan endo-1,5-alpha-L-arabinosidase